MPRIKENENRVEMPNKVMRLKFGSKENMFSLYENGILYFNTFSFFKQLEYKDDGRADRREYIDEYYAGEPLNAINIEFNGYTLSKENGLVSCETDNLNPKTYTHLYCMSYLNVDEMFEKDELISENNFAEGKDFVVAIHNVVEFKKRIIEQVRKMKLPCKEGYVEYFNPNNYGGEVGCFRKTNNYSYQNEWRLVANFGKDKENKPQIIRIGSMSDIAFPPVSKKEFYSYSLRIGERFITNNNILKKYKEQDDE